MDFKALSITILTELLEPNADNEYIAAKLRACINEDSNTLYEVINNKNIDLQRKQLKHTTHIKELLDEMDHLRITLNDEPMYKGLLREEYKTLEEHNDKIEEINKKFRAQIEAKDLQLTQGHQQVAAMNDYILSCQSEIARLTSLLNQINQTNTI